MAGRIFCHGDVHSRILEELSYTKNPEMRELDEGDILVLLGDVGVMWPGWEKEGKYQLNWLNEKPWTTILIRGNHDNEPWWESCPPAQETDNIKLLHGDLRQAQVDEQVFEKVFLVTSTADLEICGKRCLCIGGAESTDAVNLFYPHEKEAIRAAKKNGKWHRVIGRSWWRTEGINLPYLFSTLGQINGNLFGRIENLSYTFFEKQDPYFDFILTHDSPASFCRQRHLCFRWDRRKPSYDQDVLEHLRQSLKFGHWYHGHQHVDGDYEENCHCLFFDLLQIA